MARLMALDFGAKRTGIAVTDPLQIIATALDTINTDKVTAFIANYLLNEEIEIFIVGMPIQLNGIESDFEPEIKKNIRKLKQNFPNIKIERMDERFTSKMAQNVINSLYLKKKNRREKKFLDKISATIILQSYMESCKFKKIQ